MPTMKISMKCTCFFQVIILRPHPHFTRNVRKKNPQNHPHFTRLKIRRSADPQIRILPEAAFFSTTPHFVIARYMIWNLQL